jgi:hypothetical protein
MPDDLQNVETAVVTTEAPPVEPVNAAPTAADSVQPSPPTETATPEPATTDTSPASVTPDNVPENSIPTEPVITTPQPDIQTPVAAASAQPNLNERFSINIGKWKEHLALAMAKRKERWQDKLDKLLSLAQTQGTITNQQAKKVLRCTKLTAWRYLKILEKQGKIRRTGGHNTPTYELVK